MKSFEKLEILRAVVCVAGSDGEVSDSERQLIDKLCDEIGVGQASREAMIDRAVSDSDFHEQMFRVLKTEPDQTMLTVFHVAMVDGKLEDRELFVLKNYALKLGLDESTFENLVKKAQGMI